MPKNFTIHIDSETFIAPERKMTPNQLLTLAGLSGADYYLVEIHGNAQNSLKDKGDEVINLNEGAKFVSVFLGPTTVAHSALGGAALFAHESRELGYEVTELPDNHVKFPYVIDVGKFFGLKLNKGFVLPPDFPLTPPHGPHIDKGIHPIGGGGQHPTGGIHESHPGHSKHFGKGWQHWSRPHPSWSDGERSVGRYMAFIRTLWATQ